MIFQIELESVKRKTPSFQAIVMGRASFFFWEKGATNWQRFARKYSNIMQNVQAVTERGQEGGTGAPGKHATQIRDETKSHSQWARDN